MMKSGRLEEHQACTPGIQSEISNILPGYWFFLARFRCADRPCGMTNPLNLGITSSRLPTSISPSDSADHINMVSASHPTHT